jgi:hypothetical protein
MQGFADQRDPFRWIKPLTLRRIGQIVFCIWLFSVLVFGLVKTKLEQEADYRETQERMENIAGAAHRIEVADKLWDQDQEAEAIREYISVLEKPRLIEDNDTKRRLYQRTVDYMVERGDITAAKQLLEQVISDSLVISLQSPKSQSLLTEAKAEHEQKQREAQEWMDRYRREQAQRENLKAIQQPPRDRRAVPGRPAARGTTPYAHLKGEVEAIIQAKYTEARKIHGVTENKDLPGDVLGQLFEECKTEVNALYSAMPALTIDCDTNCKDIISALTTSPPELESSFLGRFFKIPVKFRVKADMDEWKSGLVGIVCDKDGAVLTKGDVYLSTDASADEMVLGWFNGGGEDELAKAYSFRIHKKAKEPK